MIIGVADDLDLVVLLTYCASSERAVRKVDSRFPRIQELPLINTTSMGSPTGSGADVIGPRSPNQARMRVTGRAQTDESVPPCFEGSYSSVALPAQKLISLTA